MKHVLAKALDQLIPYATHRWDCTIYHTEPDGDCTCDLAKVVREAREALDDHQRVEALR